MLALSGILLFLSACSSTPKPAQCTDTHEDYLLAQDNGSLKIPEGLETPDRRNALKIPADTGKAIDPKRCLQMAPNYFGAAARIAASPEEMVADWAQAWADRNTDIVMSMYATGFKIDAPEGSTAWLEHRRSEIQSAPLPASRVANLKVVQTGDDERTATFTQQFGKTTVRKELHLIREAGLWKIAGERIVTSK